MRIEHEGVPREPSFGAERARHTLEDASPVRPGRQVEERSEWADQEIRGGLEGEVAHVAFAEIELDPRCVHALASDFEHRR